MRRKLLPRSIETYIYLLKKHLSKNCPVVGHLSINFVNVGMSDKQQSTFFIELRFSNA